MSDISNRETDTASMKRAFYAAVFFACTTLFFNVCAFIGIEFFTGKAFLSNSLWDSPYAVSAWIDLFILAVFVFIAPFPFLKFKAFLCAGFFGFWAYSNACDIQIYSALAAWSALGILSVRLPVFPTFIVGAASLALCAWWNFTIYEYGICKF